MDWRWAVLGRASKQSLADLSTLTSEEATARDGMVLCRGPQVAPGAVYPVSMVEFAVSSLKGP